MNISTRDMQMISVLASELHFGRAAEILCVRQPQLSTRLAQLEHQLGVKLFVRRPRVVLTDAGRIIFDASRHAFAEFESAVQQARLMESGQVGAVVVAMGSSALLSNIPSSVQQFRKTYPDIGLTLRDMHSKQQWEALKSGLVDIGVSREVGDGSTLSHEVLGYQNFVAVLPPDHPLAGERDISVADLAHDPFVLFHPSIAPGLYHQINALCIRAGFQPKVVQEADEWYTIMGFVRAGIGVTITLEMSGTPDWPAVTTCRLKDAEAMSPVFLCWDKSRRSTSRDLLLDWLRKDASILNRR